MGFPFLYLLADIWATTMENDMSEFVGFGEPFAIAGCARDVGNDGAHYVFYRTRGTIMAVQNTFIFGSYGGYQDSLPLQGTGEIQDRIRFFQAQCSPSHSSNSLDVVTVDIVLRLRQACKPIPYSFSNLSRYPLNFFESSDRRVSTDSGSRCESPEGQHSLDGTRLYIEE